MPSILRERVSLPLEREFEGHIVREIREYFRSKEIYADVFAISPQDEKTWPSDEALHFGGKILGLQFKRPSMGKPVSPGARYNRLRWKVGPQSQFKAVSGFPEIFYCLPTYINRKWDFQSLHHCLFWKPLDAATYPRGGTVWYGADAAKPRPIKTQADLYKYYYRHISESGTWSLTSKKGDIVKGPSKLYLIR